MWWSSTSPVSLLLLLTRIVCVLFFFCCVRRGSCVGLRTDRHRRRCFRVAWIRNTLFLLFHSSSSLCLLFSFFFCVFGLLLCTFGAREHWHECVCVRHDAVIRLPFGRSGAICRSNIIWRTSIVHEMTHFSLHSYIIQDIQQRCCNGASKEHLSMQPIHFSY